MAETRRDKGSTLLALTSSALLLPAYQPARADAPPDRTQMGLRYSNYKEDDTAPDRTFGGSSERYDIDVTQFHLLAPVGEDWSVAVDVQWDDMSGASPWFVGQSADGNPNLVMSGASIKDTRTDISVTTRYYHRRGNVGSSYIRSGEDDYESNALTLDVSFNGPDNLTTWSAAVSGARDDIEPVQGVIPTHTLKAEKRVYSAWFGVSRIVNRRTVVRFGLGHTRRDGYLTDPYKFKDRRPDRREEWAVSAGYRQFQTALVAAVHIDYRYFNDDWDVESHTLGLAWHRNVGADTQVIPFLRYYSQDEADFFANLVDFSDRHYSDDYRLSAFGAVAVGLRLRRDFGNWSVNLAGERYAAREGWGLYSGEESPGLVEYWRYTVGLDYVLNRH